MSSARELLQRGKALLKGLPPEFDPGLEARLLLQKSLGCGESALWAGIDREVPPAAAARFFRLAARRRTRVPLAYVTGEREFWSLSFRVFPGVFIPRPDTEILVETAVRRSSRGAETIVDVGTGSGCVAIALSRELPSARIFAVERSRRALRAARLNAERHGAASVTWLDGDLFEPLPGRVRAGGVDMVVSNPPYIAAADWRRLAPEVRDHEPKRALAAGPDGLAFIRRLVAEAGTVLRPGGWLIFEIGAGQSEAAAALLGNEWDAPSAEPDLAGIPRAISARRRQS